MDKENLTTSATRGGLWFAATTFVGQSISWIFTFYVIRLLDPKDFGLMTMASLLTAYLQMFSELGLGAAIIQRAQVDQRSLSSAFWLVLLIGILMGGATLFLAYPTAWIFSDNRLIPITQFISVLFIIGALSTVPYHLLAREFQFKTIGLINLAATLVSSIISVTLALNGFGVYTLIWTTISLSAIKALLFFLASRWKPSFHFSLSEVKPYLRYGIVMAMSGTSLRLFQTLDKLVIGRFFGAGQLGIYQNAITISSMPLDKIWPVFQQILFPLLSRLKDNKSLCNQVYLETLKHYLLIVSPIYLGSAVVADDLVLVLLGEKWTSLTPLFQMFCVVKLFQVLTAYHVVLDNTTGHHKSALMFNVSSAVLLPGLMWVGSYHSFNASMLPWISAYPALCSGWLLWSLKNSGISFSSYFGSVWQGSMAAGLMFIGLIVFRTSNLVPWIKTGWERLTLEIILGALLFSLAVYVFQRPIISDTINLVMRKKAIDL